MNKTVVSLMLMIAALTGALTLPAFALRSQFTYNYYVFAPPHTGRTRQDGEGVPDVPVVVFGACRIGTVDANGACLWRCAGPELPVNARTSATQVTAAEEANAPSRWRILYALPVNR